MHKVLSYMLQSINLLCRRWHAYSRNLMTSAYQVVQPALVKKQDYASSLAGRIALHSTGVTITVMPTNSACTWALKDILGHLSCLWLYSTHRNYMTCNNDRTKIDQNTGVSLNFYLSVGEFKFQNLREGLFKVIPIWNNFIS